VTGKYFARERAVPSNRESYSLEESRALWAILCAQTGVPPDAPRGGGGPTPPSAGS
jgi:hypothetical protein